MHALFAPPENRPETPPAILLDIDGTLLDLAEDPRGVSADVPLLELLTKLHHVLDGAMAFVSGRSIANIDELFGGACWNAAGLYGMEIRCAGRLRRLALPIVDRSRMRTAVAALALKIPGVVLQDKGIVIALHARGSAAAWKNLVQQASLLACALPGYDIQLGNRVVDFRPLGISKAYAVERLLRLPPFSGRTPWYFGDDRADEPAFAHVRCLGGETVLVGNQTTSWASHRLAGPAEVRSCLQGLLQTMQQATPQRLHA